MSTLSISILARVTFAACASVAVMHAQAAPLDWLGNRFVYVTNGSSVAEALNVFGAGQHIPVRIDGYVEGVVSGRFSMPPQRFLDMLGKSYGLVWYYDGAVLQVSPASVQKSIAIRPHFLSASALRGALEQAGLTDSHFPLTVDDTLHTVDVLGPATYVERIRAAAERFERDAGKRVRTTVRVFRLTVANAADETRVIDGRTVVVPGAATLLRRRFEQRSPAAADDPGGHRPPLVEFSTPLPAIDPRQA
jgi:type III secretion protein C